MDNLEFLIGLSLNGAPNFCKFILGLQFYLKNTNVQSHIANEKTVWKGHTYDTLHNFWPIYCTSFRKLPFTRQTVALATIGRHFISKLFLTFSKRFSLFLTNITQGKVDGSASKPTLVQDTNYMVEKTYHTAPYLGAFEAYIMPQ